MKKLMLAAALVSIAALPSCSPSKADMKKTFVKSCEDGANANMAGIPISQDKMRDIVHNYCECAGDKVIDKFSVAEIKGFDKMSQAEREAKLMPVIQPCMDDMQKAMMAEASAGMGAQ